MDGIGLYTTWKLLLLVFTCSVLVAAPKTRPCIMMLPRPVVRSKLPSANSHFKRPSFALVTHTSPQHWWMAMGLPSGEALKITAPRLPILQLYQLHRTCRRSVAKACSLSMFLFWRGFIDESKLDSFWLIWNLENILNMFCKVLVASESFNQCAEMSGIFMVVLEW